MSTSRDNGSGTVEKLDPENMGIAAGILLLCALELEICLGGQMNPHPLAGKPRKKPLPGQGLKKESQEKPATFRGRFFHTFMTL